MARAAQPCIKQCVPRQMAEPEVSAHHQGRTGADAVWIYLPRDVRGSIGLPYPLSITHYPLTITHYPSVHDIDRRNRAIRHHFYDLLGRGLPIMVAYAMTGQQFYLSEKRIRDIIAKRK